MFIRRIVQTSLPRCAIAHTIRRMTSAYESGHVPQIEVRHRLRIAREHAGLEQSQLAEAVGVSRNTVGNAETGRVHPRRILVNAWALACGVPVSWILTGKPGDSPGSGPDNGPTGSGSIANKSSCCDSRVIDLPQCPLPGGARDAWAA